LWFVRFFGFGIGFGTGFRAGFGTGFGMGFGIGFWWENTFEVISNSYCLTPNSTSGTIKVKCHIVRTMKECFTIMKIGIKFAIVCNTFAVWIYNK
jgi:hypothetical protein